VHGIAGFCMSGVFPFPVPGDTLSTYGNRDCFTYWP
jgi:hypothetical protein